MSESSRQVLWAYGERERDRRERAPEERHRPPEEEQPELTLAEQLEGFTKHGA